MMTQKTLPDKIVDILDKTKPGEIDPSGERMSFGIAYNEGQIAQWKLMMLEFNKFIKSWEDEEL